MKDFRVLHYYKFDLAVYSYFTDICVDRTGRVVIGLDDGRIGYFDINEAWQSMVICRLSAVKTNIHNLWISEDGESLIFSDFRTIGLVKGKLAAYEVLKKQYTKR